VPPLPDAPAAGFSGEFYRAYNQLIPPAPLAEDRKDLYLLYHYLNHYNLFGGETGEWDRGSSCTEKDFRHWVLLSSAGCVKSAGGWLLCVARVC
jgi:hypothetical protein